MATEVSERPAETFAFEAGEAETDTGCYYSSTFTAAVRRSEKMIVDKLADAS